MRSSPDWPATPDHAAPTVVAVHAASKGWYGSRKIKASLERSGVTASRCRVCRVMREKQSIQRIRQEEVQGVPQGGRRGRRAERRRVRLRLRGAAHPYMQRPDLCARRGIVELRLPARRPLQQGVVGHPAGPREDARLVKPAFAALSFPISDIEVFVFSQA